VVFKTSALDGSEWPVSRPCHFILGESAPITIREEAGGSHGEVKILDPTGSRTRAPQIVKAVATRSSRLTPLDRSQHGRAEQGLSCP
jgi:hypothetical protein